MLEAARAYINMDGPDRALENIMIEPLWRSAKYEEVRLKDYKGVAGW